MIYNNTGTILYERAIICVYSKTYIMTINFINQAYMNGVKLHVIVPVTMGTAYY